MAGSCQVGQATGDKLRTARRHDNAHLDFIRSLPCIRCGNDIETEACHIRMADARIAKPITGIGIRPDDRFVLPMCGKHHREQHAAGNERQFWQVTSGLDPIIYALALHSVTGDFRAGTEIIQAALRLQR